MLSYVFPVKRENLKLLGWSGNSKLKDKTRRVKALAKISVDSHLPPSVMHTHVKLHRTFTNTKGC